MPPQLWCNYALGVLPGVVDSQTSNAEVTGYQRYTYTSDPPSESSGYTSGPLQSSDCVSHIDTVLAVLARIPEYREAEVVV